MTISTDNEDVLRAVQSALKNIVHPWEMLCGLTDIGNAYVPDIYCKREEDFDEHIDMYMDAPTPVINKESGDVVYKQWDDNELDDAIKNGQYIKIQNKPKYAAE